MTSDNTSRGNQFDTGAELKRIRGSRTHQEFADLLGVSRNTVMRYEKNERTPDAEYLFKLNLVFGVDPSRIVLGRDSVPVDNPREKALFSNYRAAAEEDKVTIDRVAELAARSAGMMKSNPGV